MEILGRIHPLVLHLPIGILGFAYLMEIMVRQKQRGILQPAIGFALLIGMLTAIFSSISGYILSLEGGYDEHLLSWHQWLGIGTAVCSTLIYFIHQNKEVNPFAKQFYMPVFTLMILLLTLTGHYGGSLTHGSDFLTSSSNHKKDKIEVVDVENAVVFSDFIQPIFKKKCVSCHNESKLKGKLLMTTIEGLKKGGENGDLFVRGDVKKSLMMQRIHLPLEEKEHMPPQGKKQMTEDEIALLEWWITTGGDYEKTVANTETPENIQTILNKYVVPADNGVLALTVLPAKESKINSLKKAGFKVLPYAQNSAFLEAHWEGKKPLSKGILKKLKGVSAQLISLDLSNSNFNDGMMGIISQMKHLQKLSIQNTQVTGKSIKKLRKHHYLEHLNLYGTKADDESIKMIVGLERLKKLFIWNTPISDETVKVLQEQHPLLEINAGVDKDIFGDARLSPPLIIAKEDIFNDTMSVVLETNFKEVVIHYTLDGSDPDSTSPVYTKPVLLEQTTDLKVIARKNGWTTSPVNSRFFVHAKYEVNSVKLTPKPHERYAADGGKTLKDFKKGTTAFTEGNWIGYEKQDVGIVMDLGAPKEISRVTVSALEATNSWIFFPKGLEISTSIDGKSYTPKANKTYPTTPEPREPELKNFSESFETTKARYVKINVKSNLTNPSWHPGAGQPCWVFLDEVLVE